MSVINPEVINFITYYKAMPVSDQLSIIAELVQATSQAVIHDNDRPAILKHFNIVKSNLSAIETSIKPVSKGR